MKIQSINNSFLHFESKKLYTAKLQWQSKKDNRRREEDVFISQINYDDIKHLSRSEFKKIHEDWGQNIVNALSLLQKDEHNTYDAKFFAIEAPTHDGIKIRGLAMVSKNPDSNSTYINYLQSFKQTPCWTIRGAGSCLIYGIIDSFARKNGGNKLSLDSASTARDFYKKIGFHLYDPDDDCAFGIKKKNFKKIKQNLRQFYFIEKLNPEEPINEN